MAWKWIAAALVSAGMAVGGYNFVSAENPLRQSLAEDPVGKRASIYAYHQYGVNPSSIVFDIWDLPYDASAADVTRFLFDYAASVRERRFDKVYFAYHGKAKFVMSGVDFRELGDERNFGQNPLFLSRTLPEKLRLPDGRAAYDTWTGGLLGVSMKQMQDFIDMHRKWYLDDM